METLIRVGVAFGVFALMMVWEALSPRRRAAVHRKQRWPVNLGLAAVNTLMLRLGVGGIAVASAQHAQVLGLGLLHWGPIPDALAIAVTLVALDLAIYGQHVATHRWPLLWRMHRVHHTDLSIDVTTAVRFHPLEIGLSMAYKLLCIYLLGAHPAGVIGFELMLSAASAFNHGNVRIPRVADRALRRLIVTPDMHRIHHSVNPAETDSNYGFCLACWDRLFKTYRAESLLPQATMPLGLPTFRDATRLGFWRLLLSPFNG